MKVEDWNKNVPVGSIVKVRLDDGREIQTTTRSEAWLLGGHTPVVQISGKAGCYRLERVTEVLH